MSGLFIAAKPDLKSCVLIRQYAKSLGVDNIIKSSDLHATIIYSKVDPFTPYPKIHGKFAMTAKAYDVCYIGKAIAILLISNFLRVRNTLALSCGLRSNFIGLVPHLSIVYDPPKNLNLTLFPKPDFEITLVEEIVKPANPPI